MALTRRQREVLDVIRQFIASNGYSPSLEEIGKALGLSSVATVHKHVTHLVEKGHVRRVWNQNRSIDVVDGGPGSGAAPHEERLRLHRDERQPALIRVAAALQEKRGPTLPAQGRAQPSGSDVDPQIALRNRRGEHGLSASG